MGVSVLTHPCFHDEDKARAFLESILWPDGPVCRKCGATDRISRLNVKRAKNRKVLFCGHCRKQFTLTTGTLFESSHIPLHVWLSAAHLIMASKKGMSAHQLHRMLGITYKSAWFMAHRLREAMTPTTPGPLGGEGKIVEIDETYWGNKNKQIPGSRGGHHKMKVFSLVERGGDVRSFHVRSVNAKTLRPLIKEHVAAGTLVMTDEARTYNYLEKEYPFHGVVNHSKGEYSRGAVTTNGIEGFFALLKRGLVGTFHHVGEQHLGRYIGEFDFRFNGRKVSDSERATRLLKGIEGKRLLYRDWSDGGVKQSRA